MSAKRRIDLMRGESFFSQGLPLYLNRSVESYELSEHQHDFFEISYVAEGSGTHMLSGISLPVKQGDLFLLPQGTSHVFRPQGITGRHPLIVYNCILAIDEFRHTVAPIPGSDVLDSLLTMDEYRQYSDKYGEALILFQQLHREYQVNRLGRELALYSGILQLLLLIHRMETAENLREGENSIHLEAVLSELHERYSCRITVQEMAHKMGLSERQFHRVFKRHMGMNMTDYLQNVRIHAARRLLRTTSQKVSNIAAAVSYQDVSYFNALFKQKTGCTPLEYRRMI
ncbi:helix-turn-helix domain-containing protein [Paenibacillus provencensis]|uniref:Helix-turn-helix domain-containing protein n=1 Tax=Paenibacillus provencensis TaxID=441151 RepID=A0ABW3PQ74_9BACL|nr:AraC family transcriptional regulator [Paenibacillus sp. MER 78]MCM3126959.1 AraC family transcriptional regulator [Paenibacillus sp. MER 78]